MKLILIISTAFLINFLFTPLFIRFLRKVNLGDEPGGRKIHQGFTPSMGGIVLFIASIITIVIWFEYEALKSLRFVLTAFLMVFLLGIRDDLVSLNPWVKLFGQIIAALMVISIADIRLNNLYGLAGLYYISEIYSYIFTILIIVGLTNSFNLIDGMDGLAGSLMFIILSFLGWWFLSVGNEVYGIFSLIFASATLSFLIFNWYPAKIFMGDTGSLTLGFIISVFIIQFIEINGNIDHIESPFKFSGPFGAALTLMAIPIFDTLRVVLKRLKNKKSPFSPDKSHIHHFLFRMGFSQKNTTGILIIIQIMFVGILFLTKNISDKYLLPLIVVFSLGLLLILERITLKRLRKKVQSRQVNLNKSKSSSKIKFVDKEITNLNIFDN